MTKTSRSIIFLMLLFLLAFQSCINDKDRKNHKWTFKVCDSLYTEIFSTFGQGAFGGDRDGKWLTDSTNFRIFLGAFDEAMAKLSLSANKIQFS
jgi:hypothetical protein